MHSMDYTVHWFTTQVGVSEGYKPELNLSV